MNARYPTPPRSPSSSEGSEDIHTLQPCTSEVTDVTEQEDVQVPPHERRDPPALSAPAIPTFEPVNMYDQTDPPAPSPIITTLEPIDMYELGDPPAPSAPSSRTGSKSACLTRGIIPHHRLSPAFRTLSQR